MMNKIIKKVKLKGKPDSLSQEKMEKALFQMKNSVYVKLI